MRASTLLAILPLACAAPSKRASPAPVLVPRNAQVIEGKYIVKFKCDAKSDAVSAAVSSITADADYTYSHSFHCFAASLSKAEVEKLQNNPQVCPPQPSNARGRKC